MSRRPRDRPRRAGGEDPIEFIRALGVNGDRAGGASGLSAPWKPAKSAAGGAALPPRGGSGGPSSRIGSAAVVPSAGAVSGAGHSSSSSSAASSAALLSTLGLNGTAAPAATAPPAATTITRNALAAKLRRGTSTGSASPTG